MKKWILCFTCCLMMITALPVRSEEADISTDENQEIILENTEETSDDAILNENDVILLSEDEILPVSNSLDGTDGSELMATSEEPATSNIDLSLVSNTVLFDEVNGIMIQADPKLYEKGLAFSILNIDETVLYSGQMNEETCLFLQDGRMLIVLGLELGLSKGDAFSLVVGDNSKEMIAPDTSLYSITLDANCDELGHEWNTYKVGINSNTISTLTFKPVRAGYEFDGWYADKEFTVPVSTFTYEIVEKYNSVLYAKWNKTAEVEDNVIYTKSDLKAALDLAKDGDTIMLTQNITESLSYYELNKDVIIDLNGYNIEAYADIEAQSGLVITSSESESLNNNLMLSVSGGNLKIENIHVKNPIRVLDNSTLTVEANASVEKYDEDPAIVVDSKTGTATVNLYGGAIARNDGPDTTPAIRINGNVVLNIGDSAYINTDENEGIWVGMDTNSIESYNYTINGKEEKLKELKLQLGKGTYTNNPAPYISKAYNYKIKENDGKYVISIEDLTEDEISLEFTQEGLILDGTKIKSGIKTVGITRKYDDNQNSDKDRLYANHARMKINTFDTYNEKLLISKDVLKNNYVFNGYYDIIVEDTNSTEYSFTVKNSYDYFVEKKINSKYVHFNYKDGIIYYSIDKDAGLPYEWHEFSVKTDKVSWGSHGTWFWSGEEYSYAVRNIIYDYYREYGKETKPKLHVVFILKEYEPISVDLNIEEYLNPIDKNSVSMSIDKDYILQIKFYNKELFKNTMWFSLWDEENISSDWLGRHYNNLFTLPDGDPETMTINVDLKKYHEDNYNIYHENLNIYKALLDGKIDVALSTIHGVESEQITVRMVNNVASKELDNLFLGLNKDSDYYKKLPEELKNEISNGNISTALNIQPTSSPDPKNLSYANSNGITIIDSNDITITINDTYQIEELPTKIKITIKADDYVEPELSSNQEIKYYVLREHNGTVEKLEATYNKETKEFTFYSDKFSAYSVGYSITTKNTDSPSGSGSSGSGNTSSGSSNNSTSSSNSGSTPARKPIVDTSVR